MIKRYRKKPVVIEAMQWTADNHDAIRCFLGDSFMSFSGHIVISSDGTLSGDKLRIRTLEGSHIASPGDYIIKGVKGEFYPCKPDIFAMTYEEVSQ